MIVAAHLESAFHSRTSLPAVALRETEPMNDGPALRRLPSRKAARRAIFGDPSDISSAVDGATRRDIENPLPLEGIDRACRSSRRAARSSRVMPRRARTYHGVVFAADKSKTRRETPVRQCPDRSGDPTAGPVISDDLADVLAHIDEPIAHVATRHSDGDRPADTACCTRNYRCFSGDFHLVLPAAPLVLTIFRCDVTENCEF